MEQVRQTMFSSQRTARDATGIDLRKNTGTLELMELMQREPQVSGIPKAAARCIGGIG